MFCVTLFGFALRESVRRQSEHIGTGPETKEPSLH